MQGYMRNDGQQTLQLAKVCRLTQPKVVILENVNGFQNHPHFKLTLAIFKWAGYVLTDKFESDLADVAPVARKRWIGTFVRKDLAVYPAVHEWFKAYDHGIDSFGFAKLDQPQELLDMCTLNQDLIKVYGDQRFLPANVQYKPTVPNDPVDVCSHRMVKTDGKFGVFMALYGRQHDISTDTLKSKKLFAELMPGTEGQIRFITPIEQALCYMVDSCEVPKNLHVAYACIGNAISPPQAIYAMHMLETILGQDSQFTPMDLVVDMVQSCLKPEHVQVTDNGQYWRLDKKINEALIGSPSAPVSPPTKKTKIDDEATDGNDEAEVADAIAPFSDDEGQPEARNCDPTAVWTVPAVETVVEQLPVNHTQEWCTVTFLMPFDTMTLRVPKGSDPGQVLTEHGFQVDYCQMRDVYTGDRLENCRINHDMVIDLHVDHEAEPTKMKSLLAQEMDFLRFVHAQQPWTNVVVAYRGHNIWSGMLPHDLELRELHETVAKAFFKIGVRCDLRWTHMARSLNPFWGWKLNTISQAGATKLHVHLPMIGGGPNSADDDLRNQLIALMANHAVPFTNLVTSVAQICHKHKAGVIKKILNIQDSEERWKAVVELGKAAVTLRVTEKEEAAAKIQNVARKKGFTKQAEVDVSTIRLIPGTFKNEDGTDAQLSQQAFSVNGSGVILTSLNEVGSWITAARHLSSDEFCAIVPGHHDSLDGTYSVQSNTVTQKPAKYVLALFSPEIQSKGIVAVWGQRFQLEGQKCAPAKSDSIQFHCRVKEEYTSQILKESGHNSVYTIPKDEQLNKPDSKYAVIWTGGKKFDAELQAKEYSESLGIVRNRRMFGYRILYDNFQEAWSHSYPDREVPKQVKVQQLFKLMNVPVSFTQSEVGQWLEGLTWVAKAIKRLGAGIWLVGAEGNPPQQACLCNGQVVIVQKIEAKHSNESRQVLVGTPLVVKDGNGIQGKPQPENMPIPDDWAKFRALRGLPNHAAEQAITQAPRDVEGPTATRLNAQDQKIELINKRLADFETKATSAVDQTNAKVDKLVDSIQEQATKFDQIDKKVDLKLKGYQQRTDQKLNQVQSAIEAATKSNDDQFRVLREMLMASAASSSQVDLSRKAQKRTPNASPRADGEAPEGDQDMKENKATS
eukprot:Skav233540  [mRNA]  locus=scaffold1523:46105:49663:- [translate_table: standard]